MRKCEFNIGDVVVIKDYEEMIDEFGVCDFDYCCANTPVFVFPQYDKNPCGKMIVIKSLDYRWSTFNSEECFVINNTDNMESDLVITTDMVKLYKTKDINSASQKDIDDFLG